MLFERITSPGLAHFSYLVGDKFEAVVIDPRRDCETYFEKASREGCRITHILETHRNEDYLAGSRELAERTGAEIWHADSQWDYRYGAPVLDSQSWEIGGLRIESAHSPGHTPGHMCYVLHDLSGEPWMLFSGDALFAGEVGRTDLLGEDRMEEMAGLLWDSLFHRLLPLGDGVILCPAHGSGSACGSVISSRELTTIGLEKKLNPRLQYTDRSLFIEHVARKLDFPPYFERMEEMNLQGPPLLHDLPAPNPLSPGEFGELAAEGTVLDTRPETSFGGAHVPKALGIGERDVAKYGGWFLPCHLPIMLLGEGNNHEETIRNLIRLGFDNIGGYLAGGMLSWLKAGYVVQSNGLPTAEEICRRLDEGEKPFLLDVRSERELDAEGRINGALHIPITQLPVRLHAVPCRRTVNIVCSSGLRSTIAASILQQFGWEDVSVVLGGTAAWSSTSCPLEPPKAKPAYTGT
ncbi:MAG: MBL fold metallo-hydrolase [Candidatus Latescibacterota bacterium]